jgi:hypothetical protein
MFHETQFLLETIYFCFMERKKWTPKSDITDSLLKFREKRNGSWRLGDTSWKKI